MKENNSPSSNWDSLSSDLQELILSYLPILSIIRSSSVCKQWKSIVLSNSFIALANKPQTWLFLRGQNGKFTPRDDLFAFEPRSNAWIKIPSTTLFSKSSFVDRNASSFFANFHENIRPKKTSPLRRDSMIVIDGERCLSMKIYDRIRDSSEPYLTLLPDIFRLGHISRSLSSVMFDRKLYVHAGYWGFTSSFELETRSWSDEKTLMPPGAVYTHLASCCGSLVLGGLCVFGDGVSEYCLWWVDAETLEFREMTKMPPDMLPRCFDDVEVIGEAFPVVRCVAKGNVVFLFDEERCGSREACVCEIGEGGDCKWRKISRFPEALAMESDRIASFCGDVSLLDVLGDGKGR